MELLRDKIVSGVLVELRASVGGTDNLQLDHIELRRLCGWLHDQGLRAIVIAEVSNQKDTSTRFSRSVQGDCLLHTVSR